MAERRGHKTWRDRQRRSPRSGVPSARFDRVEFPSLETEERSVRPPHAFIAPHPAEISCTLPDLDSAPRAEEGHSREPSHAVRLRPLPDDATMDDSGPQASKEGAAGDCGPWASPGEEARPVTPTPQDAAGAKLPRPAHTLRSPPCSSAPNHSLPSPSRLLPPLHTSERRTHRRPPAVSVGEPSYYAHGPERRTGPLPPCKTERPALLQGASSSFSSLSDQDLSFMSSSSSTSSGRYPSHRVSPLRIHREPSPSRLPSADEVEAALRASKRASSTRTGPIHPLRPPPKTPCGAPARLLSPLEQHVHLLEGFGQHGCPRNLAEQCASPQRHPPPGQPGPSKRAVVFQPQTDPGELFSGRWQDDSVALPHACRAPHSGCPSIKVHPSPHYANFTVDDHIDVTEASCCDLHSRARQASAPSGAGVPAAPRAAAWSNCPASRKQPPAAPQADPQAGEAVRRPSALAPLNVSKLQQYDGWLEGAPPPHPPSASAAKGRGLPDYTATFQQARTERREGRRSVRVPAYKGVGCMCEASRSHDWAGKERLHVAALTPRRRRVVFLAWLRGLFA